MFRLSVPPENTIYDLITSYPRAKGPHIPTQVSVTIYSGRKQPAFELFNGKTLYGEGEGERSYIKRTPQAIGYGALASLHTTVYLSFCRPSEPIPLLRCTSTPFTGYIKYDTVKIVSILSFPA